MIYVFSLINFINKEDNPVQSESMLATFDQEDSNFYTYHTKKTQYGVVENDGSKSVVIEWDPQRKAGPGGGAYIESEKRYSYGHYLFRMKSPDTSAQTNAGVVSSFFLYYSPETRQDKDNNSIADLSEIDFEFLAGNPEEIHLTAHIAYEDGVGSELSTRCLNLATGQIIHSYHLIELNGQTQTTQIESDSIPTIPGYKNTDFHTFGLDYYPDYLRYFINHDDKNITLFEISTKIPFYPMYIDCNVWHTNNWYPDDKEECVQKPEIPIELRFQFIHYEPLSETETSPSPTSNLYTTTTTSNQKKKHTAAIVIPIVFIAVVGISIAFLILYKRKRQNSKDNETLDF